MTLIMTENVENFEEIRREKTENRGPPKGGCFIVLSL
jgi:hypothetical protein